MALELPAKPRDLPDPSTNDLVGLASATMVATVAPADQEKAAVFSRPLVRALEVLPGALALFLISSLIWGYVWFPGQLAIALLVFDAYWLWKSWTIAYHVMKGVRMMKRALATDWYAEYQRRAAVGFKVLPWEDIKHVVIIPNYKESESKLRQTLQAMAVTNGALESVIPVLAMEEADAEAWEKAEVLRAEFADRFFHFIVTFHPTNIPGEVRGKSSNQAWAAKVAVQELTGELGLSIDVMTVTSCDADTIFPKQYFDALAFNFGSDRNRYRRFWQAPIFFYNNIWHVPAPLRVPNSLAGLIHLAKLSRSPKRRVLFSQSTYSLSMRMAHDVDYWDVDVIPEDWHMFLKCFYRLGGEVQVEPIHLMIGNDGALSRTPKETFFNHYLQVRRWAWGASDIPYTLSHAVAHKEIPWRKRYLRFWYVFENHIMWSTQWFFITLGGFIPWLYDIATGNELVPTWFYIQLPEALRGIVGLLVAGSPGATEISITSVVLTPCLICYFILISTDRRLRPAAPAAMKRRWRLLAYVQWLLTPPITFFFSALPALDSQIRLLLGRRMEYRVTEKV